MKDVQIIIPWFAKLDNSKERTDALLYCCQRWAALGYGPPAVARSGSERFCKAEAVELGVRESRASWLVVADADVVPPADMQTAIAKVRWDDEPWAKPYTNVYRLNAQASASWMASNAVNLKNIHNLAQAPYIGVPGGGIVVISRKHYEQIPLDKRFKGWGGEDESWGFALHTLLGPPWVGMSDLIHLWHEPQERLDRHTGNLENEALRKRYLNAIAKPDKMQRLIDESKHLP